MNHGKIILSFCDLTGNWPKFYREAGYDVRCFDLKRGEDIRWLPFITGNVHGLLFAPDCGAFAGSGAQYWPAKDDDGRTLAGLALVDACLRAVAIYRKTLRWWALENPVGRLRRWLGPPTLIFNPCDYGDPYTKKTCLWGDFTPPQVKPGRTDSRLRTRELAAKVGRKIRAHKGIAERDPAGFCAGIFRG